MVLRFRFHAFVTAAVLGAVMGLLVFFQPVQAAQADGFLPNPATVWHDFFCIKSEVCLVGDFNGDGKDDIILFKRDSDSSTDSRRGDVIVALSTGSSFVVNTQPLWHDFFCIKSEVCMVGDFNGDGKDDIILFKRDTGDGTFRGDVVVALSNGISFSGSPPALWHDLFCVGNEQCAVGDFDGDGKDDVLLFKRDTDMGAGRGDVAVATAGSGASTKFFDLSISIYRTVPASERAAYERVLEQFADGVYESSNGAHKIRTITLYQAGGNADLVDVRWNATEWPRANISGYGRSGSQIIFGDVFPFTTQLQALAPAHWCNAGYTLAHEWGHYFYGLYDEYALQPGDIEVRNSVMNEQYRACRTPPDFNWANFSIARNNTGRTEQHRVYQASGWETLARPPSQDPRNGYRSARLPRPYYPDLAAVAPGVNQDASLQMPDGRTAARAALRVVWVEPPTAAAETTASFVAKVQNVKSGDVYYPEPAMLVATLRTGEYIARAGVTASVRAPDGKTTAIILRDDGAAPDLKKDDGIYSGYMPYNQSGAHQVEIAFDNKAGNAVFTQRSYQHAKGPKGETYTGGLPPVGTGFTAAASTTVMVRNVAADDHGNTPGDATALSFRNVIRTGRIDGAGDHDVFVVKPGESGRFMLRLDNFAQEMKPKIRVLAADGTRVLARYAFTPSANRYFTASLDLTSGSKIYIEVTHRDTNAAQGLYDISVGEPLAGERYVSVYLPAIRK